MKPGSYGYIDEADVERFTARGFTPVGLEKDGKRLYYRPFAWMQEQRFSWEREEKGNGLRIYDRKLGSGDNYSRQTARIAIVFDVDLANEICEALNERAAR